MSDRQQPKTVVVDATQGLQRSGVVYVADIAKRCCRNGCRSKATLVVVAYSFDSDSWIHASVCSACVGVAKADIKRASAVDSAARTHGRNPS